MYIYIYIYIHTYIYKERSFYAGLPVAAAAADLCSRGNIYYVQIGDASILQLSSFATAAPNKASHPLAAVLAAVIAA
jgi:hypothetical protein